LADKYTGILLLFLKYRLLKSEMGSLYVMAFEKMLMHCSKVGRGLLASYEHSNEIQNLTLK